MPLFNQGDRVTMGGEVFEVRQARPAQCGTPNCDNCAMYLVRSTDDGWETLANWTVLTPYPDGWGDGQRPSERRLDSGAFYQIIRGPAQGMRFQWTQRSTGNVIVGSLYHSAGQLIRNGYELPRCHLGERITPPPGMLPPSLRMPSNPGDYRWATRVPDDDSQPACPCVACVGHECENQCRTWGCPHPDSDDCRRNTLRPWNYAEALTFYGKGPLFLGTELELQTRTSVRNRDAINIVNDHLGARVMVKGDGSIEDYGFEMAMHPMDYDYMCEHFPARELFTDLKALGVRPHRSCGMHVHVSRKGFSGAKHVFLWQNLFYRNTDQMTVLSRREPERLSRWASFERTYQRSYAKYFAKGAMGGERYSALNFCNAETVEIRIFASTLSAQQFFGALALADASVEYTRELDSRKVIKDKAWGFDAFKSYVSGVDKYNPLKREIVRLGL